MNRFISVAFAVLSSCIEPPMKVSTADTRPVVLGLKPTTEVDTNDSVRIAFSEPILSGSIDVTRANGRPVSVNGEMSQRGDELILRPSPSWPFGEMLNVTIGDGFVAPDGRRLDPPPEALRFHTVSGEVPNPRPVVRAPIPGVLAPTNLRYVAVASSPPLPKPLGHAYLDGGSSTVPLEVLRAANGSVLLEVRGLLMPQTSHRLVISHPDVAPAEPAVTTVTTSTTPDTVPPTVTSTRVSFDGDRLYVDVDADEPIVAEGIVVDGTGRTVALSAHPIAASQTRLEPVDAIAAGMNLAVHVTVVDLAGNSAPAVRIESRSPARIRARITEIVPTPLHDWSDSEGGGIPFDDRPGHGAITSTDEWVEIVNDSAEPVVIASAGLELRTVDRTPAVTRVHGAPALHFGDGGTPLAWWPGEALVVRTRGDMSQRPLTVELWSGTSLLDRLTMGDHAEADHPGGSPPDVWFESIARAASGGVRWCVPTPGDPLPAERCQP